MKCKTIHKIFNLLIQNINQHHIKPILNKILKIVMENDIPIRINFKNNKRSTKLTIGFVVWRIYKY